ncbi:MAG: zinc ribbon domain-containing protein [Sedimentisphaerales bacterium]|nr:zinc ribbon domain-containing protein [Sedimentisphaerales bacterium]
MQSKKYIEIAGKFSRVLMLTFLLSLSLFIIQLFTIGIIGSFFIYNTSPNQNQEKQQEPIDHQKLIESSGKIFLPDGSVNLAYTNYSLPEDQQCKIYDLNDNLLWQGKGNALPDKYLKWVNSTQYYMNYDYLTNQFDSMFPDSRRSFVVSVLNNREIINLWRYNYIGEYFEGFDKNGSLIAYCGSNGFTKEKSQIKPLKKADKIQTWVPVQGGGPIVLWINKSDILQIDFRKQTFQTLLHITDDSIRDILLHNWMELSLDNEYYKINEGYRPLIFCRTEKNSTYVVLRDPDESFQIKKPEGLNSDISIVTATNEKIYMRATYSSLIPPKEITMNSEAYIKWRQERMKEPITQAEELYEVDSSGNIKFINKFEWVRSPREIAYSREASLEQKTIKVLSKISPAFYDILGRLVFRRLIRYNQDIWAIYRELFRFAPNTDVYSYLLSLILAGIVFIHAWPRRKSWIDLGCWVIFAFLFNIIGLLVYLALNFTPTIKCHHCNKKRGLNTPHCPHCGAELSSLSSEKLCLIAES